MAKRQPLFRNHLLKGLGEYKGTRVPKDAMSSEKFSRGLRTAQLSSSRVTGLFRSVSPHAPWHAQRATVAMGPCLAFIF